MEIRSDVGMMGNSTQEITGYANKDLAKDLRT